MITPQLYFLSILCNGLSGYILFSGNRGAEIDNGVHFSINNPTFHLVLGILSAVTGVLKLLSPSMGIPILGDLVPAAAGVAAGLLLIFGIYRRDASSSTDSADSTETTGKLDNLGGSMMRFRKTIGLGLLAIALIHFLFPQAIFL